jgi:predicted alpha/beta superfamily hydrolase
MLMLLAAMPLATALAAVLDAGTPLTVADASQHILRATGSGREYQISIARPVQPAPAAGYPVIYVLDANAMVLTAIEAVRAHERRLDRGQADVAVVVGIGYLPGINPAQERSYDLTPAAASEPRIKQRTGGADDFLDFIELDLKPAIAASLPIDPQRQALFGHSLAGQFTLYALVTRPQLFDTYLAASPSLWYGDGYLLNRLPEVAKAWQPGQRPKRVLLTVGQYEQELHPALRQHPLADEFARKLDDMRQLDRVQQAVAQLQDIPGVLLQYQQIPSEDHGSVVPAALGRAAFFTMIGPKAPAVPAAQQYWQMTPKQRYDLRLWVRDLPDAERIPWLTQLRDTLHAGLSAEQVAALHEERNQMDKTHGTKPHLHNATPRP